MVRVLDQNDNKPLFPEQIYKVQVAERERRRKGEAVFRVSAFDPDEGSNARLSYGIVDGNHEGKFSIDARSGVVFSRKASAAGNYDILTVRACAYTHKYRSFRTLSRSKSKNHVIQKCAIKMKNTHKSRIFQGNLFDKIQKQELTFHLEIIMYIHTHTLNYAVHVSCRRHTHTSLTGKAQLKLQINRFCNRITVVARKNERINQTKA